MSETLQQLYDEAAELNLRVFRHWAVWEDVIQWADSWIGRLDTWPDEITEISLNGRHKDSGARAALATLAQRGRCDAVRLVRLELSALESGKTAPEVISSLYPLTYDTFLSGGQEFVLDVPEVLRTALYKLDYALEATDPEHGWADFRGQEAEAWLKDEIRRELSEALAHL